MHLLPHGGEHGDHADAGDRPRRVRPQPFLQEQLPVQAGPTPRAFDYLNFAKSYIGQCEERHGHVAVERTLDAAHALMTHGVHRYPGKKKLDLRQEEKRARARRATRSACSTTCGAPCRARRARAPPSSADRRRALLGLPQENILYFLEKSAPRLKPWQRELLRIVRHIAQYFYPQRQTKVMNEGAATYVHYRIMTACTSRAASPTATSSSSCSRTPTSCSSPATTTSASPASIPTRSASP